MASKGDKTIVILQKWGSGKINIGTEYTLRDTDRTMTLVSDTAYPNGKFVFNDGEIFDPGKYFDSFFIEKVNEEEIEEEHLYDEELWDKVDNCLNENNNSLIINSLGKLDINQKAVTHNYFDVTDIIETIKKDDNDIYRDYISIFSYEVSKGHISKKGFSKSFFFGLFLCCDYVVTSDENFVEIIYDNKKIGYLAEFDGKYLFTFGKKYLPKEYKYTEDNSQGFYYTGENYLDIALSSINRYENQFVPLYGITEGKNKESFGYQVDTSIKTLLSFACECFLKSLIIKEGKSLEDIKRIGHGLTELFTSLNDDTIAEVFSYMENHGYSIKDIYNKSYYNTNDLTEKFMLDLASVDDAFIDARYSAENDKNTEYTFLYDFAIALRESVKSSLGTVTPFDKEIDKNIAKKLNKTKLY